MFAADFEASATSGSCPVSHGETSGRLPFLLTDAKKESGIR
jgi:hypothetical protein